MKFTVVVPTYNRPKDLSSFLNSVLGQNLLPSEVLIIDDGDLDNEYINKYKIIFKEKNVFLNYYKKDHEKERRGLSESKNKALEIASYDIVFFFDDDIIIDDSDYFIKIMDIWKENKDDKLIGVGGLIKRSRKKTKFEKVYNKIFLLDSGGFSWNVTKTGFQVWDEYIKEKQKGFYSHGGVSSYRKDLAEEFLFPTFSGGRTGLEDVDFCMRAKARSYFFIIEPGAKVIHNHVKTSRENDFLIGEKESQNRKIIFRSNCKDSFVNRFIFLWNSLGWILRQFLAGNFNKGLGMMRGFFKKT
ncbi:glycosyltransferase [bacterium]|nr:glycosyltransferase [bacterium]